MNQKIVTLYLFCITFSAIVGMDLTYKDKNNLLLRMSYDELLEDFNAMRNQFKLADNQVLKDSKVEYETLKYYCEKQLDIASGSLEELEMLGNPFLMYPLLYDRKSQKETLLDNIDKYSFYLNFLNNTLNKMDNKK